MSDAKKLLKLDDSACSVCKADFFKTDLDEMGRCPVCSKANILPGGKQKQDFVYSDAKPPTKDELKVMIREVLRELKEEEAMGKAPSFAPKVCTKCKKEFIPQYPAEKVCSSCKELETK